MLHMVCYHLSTHEPSLYHCIYDDTCIQHTLGRAQVLRHIRDGRELRPLDLNEAYDFNYQQFAQFDEEDMKKG